MGIVRTLSFSRKYDLRNFNNTDIGSGFLEIPEEYALNQALVDYLMTLLMLTADHGFYQYMVLRKSYSQLGAMDALARIEFEQKAVLDEIRELLSKKEEVKDETEIS